VARPSWILMRHDLAAVALSLVRPQDGIL
jgi:hypothetical protein